jgi:hypothetical protein
VRIRILAFSPSTAEAGTSHRRRLSRSLNAPVADSAKILSPTFGSTPFHEEEDDYTQHSTTQPMSLSRSPSPRRDGGWSSPGLSTPYDEANGRSRSPRKAYGGINGGPQGVTWASAKANSARVNGYPSYQSQNKGFFSRHMRNLSESLPYFAHGGQEDRHTEKEKSARGWQSNGSWADVPRRVAFLLSRRRKYAAILVLAIFAIMLWFSKRKDDFLFFQILSSC